MNIIVIALCMLLGGAVGWLSHLMISREKLRTIREDYPAVEETSIMLILQRFGVKTTYEELRYMLKNPPKK